MSKLQLDRRDFLQTISRAAGAMVFAGLVMLLAPSRRWCSVFLAPFSASKAKGCGALPVGHGEARVAYFQYAQQRP